MRLCLGTAQLGMDYGVRGQSQPSLAMAREMLDYALHNGVDTIDTAKAYGEAEEVVGSYFERNPSMRHRAVLISKFPPSLLESAPPERYYSIMKTELVESLRRLRTDYLDGYLMHSASSVYNDEAIVALTRLKGEGIVRNIGVSIYEVDEAKAGILRGDLDFLQLPFSVLDQRMLHSGIFALAEEKKVMLHSRSVFVQGLALMDESEVPPFLSGICPYLRQLDDLCRKSGLNRAELAIGFVKRQNAVSHLVFGVDNLTQLKEFVAMFRQDVPEGVAQEAARKFACVDPGLVMPNRWKR